MNSTDSNAEQGSRPALNKTGSSGRNIYGSMVRKTSEKHLYGDRSESIDDKKKTRPISTERLKTVEHEPDMIKLRPAKVESQNSLSRSGSLKKDIFIKQQSNLNISLLTSTPTNQKPPTSILNNSNRSRASTFKTNSEGDASLTDSGLKTPISAIQFQFEDKIPLRRLPHQHRGSMTPRVNTQVVPSDLLNDGNQSDAYASSQLQNVSRNGSIIHNASRKVSIALPIKEKKNIGSPSGGGTTSDAPLSAISMNSSNNNSSFLSVSINDIVAQLTGKVDTSSTERKASSVEIPGGFGDDEVMSDGSRGASPLSAISTTSTTSKKSSTQLVPIHSLIAKNESESMFTKQKISEFLPKQDDGKYHILLGATGSVASI